MGTECTFLLHVKLVLDKISLINCRGTNSVHKLPSINLTVKEHEGHVRMQKKSHFQDLFTITLASFPGSPHTQTASDEKLGGTWEQGY